MAARPPAPIAVIYFANGPEAMYQVNDWLRVLTDVVKTVPLSFVCRDETTAQVIAQRTHIPVFHSPNQASTEALFDQLSVGVVLYLNQFRMNFDATGYSDAFHVFMSHGESDKSYMSQNSLKIFDYFFVAGEAARERISRALPSVPHENIIPVGRPQLHFPPPTPAEISLNPDLPTLMYAPTWEGTSKSMAYSSVVSHGVALAKHLVEQSDINFIYRPHPFLGMHSKQHAKADRIIRGVIEKSEVSTSPGVAVVDESDFGWQLIDVDWLISDLSAVAYDWLSTGKPALICQPTETSLPKSGLFEVYEVLESKGFPHHRDLFEKLAGMDRFEEATKAVHSRFYSDAFNAQCPTLVVAQKILELTGRSLTRKRNHLPPETSPAVKLDSRGSLVSEKGKEKRKIFIVPRSLKRLAIRGLSALLQQTNSSARKSEALIFISKLSSVTKRFQLAASINEVRWSYGIAQNNLVACRRFRDFLTLSTSTLRQRFLGELQIIWVPTVSSLESLLTRSQTKAIFYPEMVPDNQLCLRFGGYSHFLLDTESLGYRGIRNLKAYDNKLPAGHPPPS